MRRSQVIVLLADGFDEAAVSLVLSTLRQAGVAVSLVGLRAGPANGAYGMVVVPDMSLDRLLERDGSNSALIVPGGAGHLARLQADPRVGGLLRRAVEVEAMVVGLDQAADELIRQLVETNHGSDLEPPPQGEKELETIVAMLVQRLLETRER
jgi:transcriptional regulator GlxA family with amidase domain